jgi:hypothetical protein
VKLTFNEKQIEELNEWLENWKKWRLETRAGPPDSTISGIYLMPLTVALLKSASILSRLTWVLIFLTGFLVIEVVVRIARLFW